MSKLIPNKPFLELCKRSFASLTSRKAPFLYLNIVENNDTFILGNLKPEDFVKYCDATFGVHFLKFKNNEDMVEIKKLFTYFNLLNKGPYVVNITKIISLLNAYKGDYTEIHFTCDENGIICLDDESKTILAYPIVIYQAIRLLQMLYEQYGNDTICTFTNCIDKDINIDNISKNRFHSKDYVDKDNKAVFDTTNKQYEFNIGLIDGVDIVSVKDFLKKTISTYICKLRTWVRDKCIEYCTVYEDESISVLSIRPHTHIYIKIRKGAKTDD